MEIVYVKTISGSHYKIEGDELEIKADAFVLKITDTQAEDIFPWTNIEHVYITAEPTAKEGDNAAADKEGPESSR